MNTFAAKAIKATFSWKAENKPPFDPTSPVLEVNCGGVKLIARLSPKQARKLQAHQGGGKIEGKLVLVDGRLELAEASAQFFDPPKEPSAPSPVFALPPLAEIVRQRAAV